LEECALDLKAAITPAPNSTEAAEVQDNRSPSEDSGLASPGKLKGKNWVALFREVTEQLENLETP
jgi:hypothetical protein